MTMSESPTETNSQKPFLTARWSDLALVTYAVPPEILAHHVPPNCELDIRFGNAYASLVAFDFQDCKVLGISWPGFRQFSEINLRFYVRHAGTRGVSFVREFVPMRTVAALARSIYNEPYKYAPMTSAVERNVETLTINHSMQFAGQSHSLKIVADAKPMMPGIETVEHFFKEHEWGFGKTRSNQLIKYRVEHPRWQIHPVQSYELKMDWEKVYGPAWAFLQDQKPENVILAAGSSVKVFPKTS